MAEKMSLEARLERLTEVLERRENVVRKSGIAFLVGAMRGLGFVIGTVILLAGLVWLFGLLGGMPVIGDWLMEGMKWVTENANVNNLNLK